MKFNLRYDIIAIILIAIPFIYLATIWGELPDSVPIHWNIEGEIDDYGSKGILIAIPFALPMLTYLIFLFTPVIDPKKRLDADNKKYQSLKLLLTGVMSAMALYILYASKTAESFGSATITIIFGVLFIILGNYIKTLKPNYFIGIRTPWTLESEDVWRKTHKSASLLWFIGGLLIIALSFLLPIEINFIVFIGITIIITLAPIVHSYLIYKGEKK